MSFYKIVLFANSKYLNQCKERLKEFENLKIDNHFIYCLDKNLYFQLETTQKEYFLEIDNSNFRKSLWYKRTEKINDLIKSGIDILHVDGDCIWHKNPSHIFEDNPNIDMFFACGLDYPTNVFKKWGFVLRGGFYYIRSNDNTKIFLDKWLEQIKVYEDDQVALNNLLMNSNVKWNMPQESDKIYMTYHKDNNYNFVWSKKHIVGYTDTLKIMALSAYDFPRLQTLNLPYATDLHYRYKDIGNMP